MSSLAVIRIGNIDDFGSVFAALAPQQESIAGLRPAQLKAERRVERYGHRAAVVLSSSSTLRSLLEQALFARGAAVANLSALPQPAHVQELLASGLILLAPPDQQAPPNPADGIDVSDLVSTADSIKAILAELERRGVLLSRYELFLGEGI